MIRSTDDSLGVMLRQAAALESVAPEPASHIRRRAEQRRAHRRVATAAAAALLTVGGGALLHDALSPTGWLSTAPATPPAVRLDPPPAPTPAPSATATAPDRNDGAAPSGDDKGGPAPSATSATPPATASFPAPPSAHVDRPWQRAGYDYGAIVGARMEGGRAVITFDRKQLYTAEQWEARTGKPWDFDFRILNDSTRTREFVVEPSAAIYLDWMYHPGNNSLPRERATPQEFVRRTQDLLPSTAEEGVGVWLFHTGGIDGPVAYVDDASPEIG